MARFVGSACLLVCLECVVWCRSGVHLVQNRLTLACTRHFAILDGTSGRGVGATLHPWRFQSKRELSGKDQRIALDEYSRLMVRIFTLGQNLTQL